MKTQNKTAVNILLALIATILFKGQSIGINAFIFSLCSFGALLYLYPKPSKEQLISVLPCLLVSAFLAVYPQGLSIFVWLVSYIVMWSWFAAPISPLLALPTGLWSVFAQPIRSLEAADAKIFKQKLSKRYKSLGIYLISGIIVLVFALLYMGSNPVLSQLLSFINGRWIFLNLFFFCFFFGLLFGLLRIKIIDELKARGCTNKSMAVAPPLTRGLVEFKIAKISITLLGIMLCLVNIVDLVPIIAQKLPQDFYLSQYLKQSFFGLLFSMFMCLVLIFYFFRGAINKHKQIKSLRKLCYFWIAQNLLMAGITAYKLQLYTSNYGLTHKRFAVLIVLAYIIVALWLSISKVRRPTNNWYFFNRLFAYAYLVFTLSALVPYEFTTTHYNLSHAKESKFFYLSRFEMADFKSLRAYAQSHEVDDTYSIQSMNRKYNQKISEAKQQSWQSWNLYSQSYKNCTPDPSEAID